VLAVETRLANIRVFAGSFGSASHRLPSTGAVYVTVLVAAVIHIHEGTCCSELAKFRFYFCHERDRGGRRTLEVNSSTFVVQGAS
jgi:hypothetical protein